MFTVTWMSTGESIHMHRHIFCSFSFHLRNRTRKTRESPILSPAGSQDGRQPFMQLDRRIFYLFPPLKSWPGLGWIPVKVVAGNAPRSSIKESRLALLCNPPSLLTLWMIESLPWGKRGKKHRWQLASSSQCGPESSDSSSDCRFLCVPIHPWGRHFSYTSR